MKQSIIQARGSIQHIQTIPVQIRELYKTVWEMDGRTLINMAADRGVYIDQSQSLNVHMTNVSLPKLYALHFYTWTKGLKTGMYYLRSMAATQPLQITIPPEPVCKACEG
jgi:ribonucleotide reductase alpha subunit